RNGDVMVSVHIAGDGCERAVGHPDDDRRHVFEGIGHREQQHVHALVNSTGGSPNQPNLEADRFEAIRRQYQAWIAGYCRLLDGLALEDATGRSKFDSEAEGSAPEIEMVECERVLLHIRNLDPKGAEVTQIATHTQMVREESHQA